MFNKRSKKGIAAWLVTWECVGDHAKPERKIAAIFNPRWSAERIREYVELIYVNSYYSISERISYAKNRRFNPYPAEFARINGVTWQGQITCGPNPFLFARLVDNLVAADDSDDEERIVWTERPKPDCNKLGIWIKSK
ncbi:MAG: hypothetical protein WC486_00150 [Candidatus Omnitrophota bacterium]